MRNHFITIYFTSIKPYMLLLPHFKSSTPCNVFPEIKFSRKKFGALSLGSAELRIEYATKLCTVHSVMLDDVGLPVLRNDTPLKNTRPNS